MVKHFLSVQDIEREEIERILEKTYELKKNPIQPLLKGKNLAMIFEKPSTRTRVSFEVGMNQLGGHTLYLSKNDLQLGHGETIRDTAEVLSRYVDFIGARVYSHKTLEELAKHSKVPVINLLSDLLHPCQALSDMFTIREHFGRLKGLKLAWVGDGNNVCNSTLLACSKLGLDISIACPKGYEPDKNVLKISMENTKKSGANIFVTNDPREAVRGAQIVATDTWISMGQEREKERRIKIFKKYQVNRDLVKLADRDFVFMHCLPNYHLEVTDEIAYGRNSIIFTQAENRLHAQKAILLYLSE
jgi:ornithine carbamoyltransferase